MALAREAIVQAIQSRLGDVSVLKRVTRRVRDWASSPEQPACIIIPEDQTATAERGLPTVWTLAVTLLVYVKAEQGMESAPDTVLNQVLAGIEAALEPDIGHEVQDLGGLCHRCSISGTVSIGTPAESADQYVAEIPLEVIASA